MLTSQSPQERNPDGSPAAPNAAFKPHPMQGWSPDFVPKLTADAVAMEVIHRILTIAGPDAMKCSKDLATKEGIFVASRPARPWPARCRSPPMRQGRQHLGDAADTGERYLSTPLFADVPADMTDEEWAITRMTPGFQMKPA